jgi:hypothetical protein
MAEGFEGLPAHVIADIVGKDAQVLEMCERIGFGFVMESAARQWEKLDPVGAFTVGDPKGFGTDKPDGPGADGPHVQVDDIMANLGDFADRIDRHGFVNAMGGHAQHLRKAVTALAAKGDVDPWHWCDSRKPDEGRRVVILYEDGSGAFIGYWTGETLLDHDGEDHGWREEPGAMWAYLPKGFTLWCEDRQDDPFTFPTDKT